MRKYRKKPVEAVQWFKHGDCDKVLRYGDSIIEQYPKYAECGFVETLEGNQHVIPSDWIIKGINGEYYLCKSDIFAAIYEPV